MDEIRAAIIPILVPRTTVNFMIGAQRCGWSLLITASLLACTEGGQTLLGSDSGARDTGSLDTGRNFPDRRDPADVGPSERPPPPDAGQGFASEGLFCTGADRSPGARAFVQGDCAPGLLCVPWDVVSGRQNEVTSPLASCVKPCSADDECSEATRPNRTCSGSFGFTDESGAARLCVDAVSEIDEYCGGSRLIESKIPDVRVQTGRQMVGCAAGECSPGRFADVHPDESICLEYCQIDADCSNPERSRCNPVFFDDEFTGVCSPGPLPGRGDFCGTDDPNKVGLTTRCDQTSEALTVFCAGTNIWNGVGFCLELCGSGHPCIGETSRPSTCEILDPGDPQTGGFCLADCENSPENCGGDGQFRVGRFCFTDRVTFNAGGNNIVFTDCMSRRRQNPPFDLSYLDRYGSDIEVLGDNCEDPAITAAFAACPEPSHCLNIAQDQGICVGGCDLTDGARGGCEAYDGLTIGTATCTPALAGVGGLDPENGLCGVIVP